MEPKRNRRKEHRPASTWGRCRAADREMRLMALHILSAVDENMTKYFGTFTIVNLCLGAATVLLNWAVGLPNPLL